MKLPLKWLTHILDLVLGRRALNAGTLGPPDNLLPSRGQFEPQIMHQATNENRIVAYNNPGSFHVNQAAPSAIGQVSESLRHKEQLGIEIQELHVFDHSSDTPARLQNVKEQPTRLAGVAEPIPDDHPSSSFASHGIKV